MTLVWNLSANYNGGLEHAVDLKSVPRLLIDEQKHRHVFVYQELMDGVKILHELSLKVIT
jgi:hypothetical protein